MPATSPDAGATAPSEASGPPADPHAVHQSVEARDAMVESGMEEAVDDGFDRLDELLERLATPRLEVVVPVSDVDRAKHFYAEQMGFPVDVDHARTSCSASSR